MRRREFITLISGTAATWPLAGRAQQTTTPLIGFLSSRSPNESEALVTAFRQGLADTGYVEGQNIHLAFRWADPGPGSRSSFFNFLSSRTLPRIALSKIATTAM